MKLIVAFLCGILICTGLWAADIVKIDPDKTAEPISPFIYGQFTEHLGRSFYGGIWAEMLDDRKFCFPITDNYDPWGSAEDKYWDSGPFPFLKGSPWKVIGPPGTVVMDKDHAFVGEHSPEIHLTVDGRPAGISQEGLALVGGKDYTGRIVLAGDESVAPITIQLVQDGVERLAQIIDKIGPDYQTYPLHFTATADSDNARLEITGSGQGSFRIGTVSLMPADNIEGFRSDTLAELKKLNSPVYRWPGGNFVSGYNWHDGVGDRDKRPPRTNPAWKGIEANDVGIHEFMELMKLLNSRPYVAINTGLGTVQQASEEVAYFNDAPTSPMGMLRAANGHPEPFNVHFWAVGNEMYGDWQLGHMPVAQYVLKHNAVADAIWKISPQSWLVGVGNVGDWDAAMMQSCAGHMNLVSEHIYVKQNADVPAHAALLADGIKKIADAFRVEREASDSMKGKNIRIAMDEWNYWYGPYVYGELGVQYHLKDALGVARGLHEFFRNSDIFYMANYAQTVNVIGAIKTSRTAATLDATGVVLALYRAHFGTLPVEIAQQPADLDVSVAWTADKTALTVAVVNPTSAARAVTLDSGSLDFQSAAKQWIVTGPDPLSHNEPGKPPEVTLQETDVQLGDAGGMVLPVPPLSVVMYRLEKP